MCADDPIFVISAARFDIYTETATESCMKITFFKVILLRWQYIFFSYRRSILNISVTHQKKFNFECFTVLAAGYGCPRPGDAVCIHFFNNCATDAECVAAENSQGDKCCLQPDCGLSCRKSVWTRSLQCPIPEKNRVCKQYLDQCTNDKVCIAKYGRRSKCCPQPGCGLECKTGVYL